MFIELAVETPVNLTSRQKELLREFDKLERGQQPRKLKLLLEGQAFLGRDEGVGFRIALRRSDRLRGWPPNSQGYFRAKDDKSRPGFNAALTRIGRGWRHDLCVSRSPAAAVRRRTRRRCRPSRQSCPPISAITASGCGNGSWRAAPTAMPDYELLELVLFRAIPRQDVKPLARRLLDTLRRFQPRAVGPARAAGRGAGRRRGRGAGAEDRRGGGASHDAGAGDAAAGDVGLGRGAGLLPHHHGASRDRTVPGSVSRPQERADRRRGTGARHRRSRPGLSARGGQAGAGTERLGADPGAQPPLWRPDAVRGRYRR